MIPTLLLPTLFAIAAFVVLIQSGKYIVRAVSTLARAVRISEFVLSFVLIAFATSLPELAVGVNAALSGVPELSLGDIIGTNIMNVTLVLGAVALIGGAVQVRDYSHFSNNRLFQLTIVLAPLILLLDGTLSRLDGVILLLLLLWHLARLLDIDDRVLGRKVLRPHLSPYATEQPFSRGYLWQQVGVLFLASVCLVASTYAIIYASKVWVEVLAVPAVVVGVLVIATATSLPELVIGMRSARAAHGGVALGDIFGAAAINATLTLGVVALIHPIVITDYTIIYTGIGYTVLAFLLVFFFLYTKRSISRWEGVALLGCYVLFVLTQLLLL